MKNITLGEIAIIISFLATVITGIGIINGKVEKYIGNAVKDKLNEINDNVKDLGDRIDSVDMQSTKNFLVNFLAKLDHGDSVDEIERQRFWEQYQHYEKAGGNSYIHQKVERLKEQHKL